METSVYLKTLFRPIHISLLGTAALMWNSSTSAQLTEFELAEAYDYINYYPQVSVFPKYAVIQPPAIAIVEHVVTVATTFTRTTACNAKPRTDGDFGNVVAKRNGNEFTLSDASQFINPRISPTSATCLGTYPVSLGTLGAGKYSVSVFPLGKNPKNPSDVATRIEFAVLTMDQAKKGTIEIPAENSVQSGIGLISGWSCIAEGVEISINGGPRQRMPSESPRGDVEPVCSHSNAGFGLLFNYNTLAAGEHTIQLYVKTIPIGGLRKFRVVKPKGEFASGLKSEVTVSNFPEAGKSTTLDWREGEQRFGIKSVQ